MRPRISQKEAQFICELLEVAISDLELKQQYYKELDSAVFSLKRQILRGAGYEVVMAGFSEKKRELEKWQVRLRFIAYHELIVAQRMLAKYRAIAEGEKHRGRYKHLNCAFEYSLFSNDKGKLKEVLGKQLEPIEDLGKHQPIAEQRINI